MSPSDLRLIVSDTALLVIDLQERLAAAMEPAAMDRLRLHAAILLEGARALGLPVLLTEQYPRGLGPTLRDLLTLAGESTRPLEKTAFSCCQAEGVLPALEASGRRSVLITGMETHVCVFQTARDLVERGYRAFVPHDAVLARAPDDHRIGLDLIARAGGVVTTTEAALFDLLGVAGGEAFKIVSRLVRERPLAGRPA